MREILFKGKRVDNFEWVYGDLIHRTIWNKHITVIRVFDNGFDSYEEYEVILDTVGQYTGLTDKNGTKIFEGDMVTTDIERPYLIVEYRDGAFMFNCNDGGKDYYDIMLPITDKPHEAYEYGEVIGNIHDNPELLKERETEWH